jgi:hypothetical protein
VNSIRIAFVMIAVAIASPVAAQWHADAPIDPIVSLSDLNAWAAAHAGHYIGVPEDGMVSVINPYDHAETARVAIYEEVDTTVHREDGMEDTRATIYALRKVRGGARQHLDVFDLVRIGFLTVEETLMRSPLLILAVVVLICIGIVILVLGHHKAPAALQTQSLCDEVERRFRNGGRRW